jgi:hypothetical protein
VSSATSQYQRQPEQIALAIIVHQRRSFDRLPEDGTTEWKSTALRAYQRRTKQADSLMAGAYLAGTNTRRVRRALSAVFGSPRNRSSA